MRQWELEANLQQVAGFNDPAAEYEQYLTPPHLAAKLATCLSHDLEADACEETRTVCDLGCGTGMLTKSCLLAGAAYVLGVDIDADALATARANCIDDAVDFVCADVATWSSAKSKCFDYAVTNPPFGTKRRGVDVLFLCAALNLARVGVYSMHKTATRDFIGGRFEKYGVRSEVVAEMRFELPKTYSFQKSRKPIDVSVDLWRFDVSHAEVIDIEAAGIRVERPIETFGGYDVNTRKTTGRQRGNKNNRGRNNRGRRRK